MSGGAFSLVALYMSAGISASSEQNLSPNLFQDKNAITEMAPSSYLGQYLAGREALRDQDPGAAVAYFDDALHQRSTDGVLLSFALQAALGMGNVEKALELAPLTIKEAGGNSAAYLVLALDALRHKNYISAKANLEKTGDNGFNVLLKPLLMSWIDLGNGDVKTAMADLDALDKFNGFEALKMYHLALLADASGQSDLANTQYVNAMNGFTARSARLLQSYGAYLERQGRPEEAKALFETYIKEHPSSPIIQLLLKDIAAGRKIPPVIESPVDGAAEALYTAASIIGREQATSIAATYIYFALMLEPDFPVARVMLAEAEEDRGQWQEALNLYSQIDPNSIYGKNAKIRSAWAIYKLGRNEEAVTILEAIAEKYPDDIKALVVLADLKRDLKSWNDAAQQYARAIGRLKSDDTRHWSLFYARGIAYEQSKQWDLAEADLLKALELNPEHPQILNYLAYSWVDRDENLQKAKEMLIKAVSLRPNDGYIIDSLGWLYYRLGDFDNAVAQLEKAVSLEAADSTINDHLGDAFWRIGRRDEARYQWQRALWLDPAVTQIPLIREKLLDGLSDDVKAEAKSSGPG